MIGQWFPQLREKTSVSTTSDLFESLNKSDVWAVIHRSGTRLTSHYFGDYEVFIIAKMAMKIRSESESDSDLSCIKTELSLNLNPNLTSTLKSSNNCHCGSVNMNKHTENYCRAVYQAANQQCV